MSKSIEERQAEVMESYLRPRGDDKKKKGWQQAGAGDEDGQLSLAKPPARSSSSITAILTLVVVVVGLIALYCVWQLFMLDAHIDQKIKAYSVNQELLEAEVSSMVDSAVDQRFSQLPAVRSTEETERVLHAQRELVEEIKKERQLLERERELAEARAVLQEINTSLEKHAASEVHASLGSILASFAFPPPAPSSTQGQEADKIQEVLVDEEQHQQQPVADTTN